MITLETNDDNSGTEIKDSADDKGKIFMFILCFLLCALFKSGFYYYFFYVFSC